MATIIGTVVGAAIGTFVAGPGPGTAMGAAIGAGIGGSIGAYIDSTYLFPLLFPADPLTGPRAGDQPIMTGAEGSAMHWVLGPQNRVSVTVIWKSDLIEKKSTTGGGKGGGPKPKVEKFTYSVDIALGVCDTTDIPGNAINKIVKVFADTKLIYDGTTTFNKYDALTIYDGSQTTTDPLIVSYEGEANTPVFRRLCYIVINRLQLADFGNRIPNLTVIVEQANPWTLQETVGTIMQRAGYQTSEFVVNRMDQCMNGYNISGPQKMNGALAPLMLANNINVQERDMIINFIPKGEEDEMTVEDVGDLAAHSTDDDTPRPLQTLDNDDFDIPSEVVTKFFDSAHDLEKGSQRQPRWDHVSQNRVTIDLPMTLSPNEALNVSKRILWSAEAERQRTSVSLPPKYLALREGMSLRIPSIGGRTRVMWVRRVTIGNDFRVEAEGAFYQPDVYKVESDLDDSSIADDLYTPPATLLAILDLPNLSTATEGQIGLTFGVSAEDPLATWRGAQLWQSFNNVDYDFQVEVIPESIIGLTRGGFLDIRVGPHRWDRSSKIRVEIFEGALESASEDDVVNGSNRAVIQSETGEYEVIAFATATLVDPRTYDLTNLLRGLRGTAHLIREHASFDKRFVLGETAVNGFIERAFGDGSYWKAPSTGGLLGDFEAQAVVVTGISIRPFAPWNLRGEYQPNGDLVLTWDRRMKYIRGLFAVKTLPVDESPETYEIDIIQGNDPVYGTVVRQIVVAGQTTITYDAASQAADGLSNIPVAVNVFQKSHVVGRSPYQFGIFFR